MQHKYLISILMALIPVLSRAQWSEGTFSTENILLGKPLVIVNENLHITISGKDNIPWAFEINRKVRYRISDEAGLAYFKELKLPEDFDPTFVSHAPAVKNLGIYYSGYKVESFEVTVHRDRETPFEPKVRKKIQERESFNLDYLYRYSQHVYSIEGLQVGDELEVDYQVIIPFSSNYSRFASYRLFFHSNLPKLSYRFTLSHHETLDIELYEKNGARARRVRAEEHFIHRTWDLEDLPGCTDEAGARPYLELPHLNFVLNHYRYYVHNSFQLQSVPHYAVIASMRAPEITEIMNAIQIGSTFENYLDFNKKLDEMTRDVPNDFNALHHVHQLVTDEFKYVPDRDYYRREDLRSERLGEFFTNGVLRDRSRYNLYYAIFTKSDVNFFSAFPIDKRIGVISDEYFQPNFDSDFILATYFGEKFMDFVIPKSGNTGWYYNEMPFYWEDCKVRMVHVTDYLSYKAQIRESVNSMQTPFSEPRYNLRILKVDMDVDADLDSLYCKGVMKLSGQYSTMGRAKYISGATDPTIYKAYDHKFWDIRPDVVASKPECGEVNPTAPFDVTIANQYHVGGVITKEGKVKEIDLSGCFSHIVPDDFDRPVRYLSYYPDFLGTEYFQYNLKFPKPVETSDTGTVISVETEFGRYELKVEQTDNHTIAVSSAISVNKESVAAANYSEVWKVYRAVERANAFRLRYTD